ncbi:CUE domain-containing protein 2-A-like [Penaeus indicus]|uniref:CUE domain-containing protein 2-A-like n=1 Tax=Penaeus indicus TaxID=29960 RepID=UPI00300D8A08
MSADSNSVRNDLIKLLHKHVPGADISGIDEIVISYVTGVLEEVAADAEEVDSASMKDVISAYVPAFDVISEDILTAWVLDMVQGINEEKEKDEIVISYVTGVLEEVAADAEEVDSASMKDVISAYVPAFDVISEDILTAWVLDMVQGINEEKEKDTNFEKYNGSKNHSGSLSDSGTRLQQQWVNLGQTIRGTRVLSLRSLHDEYSEGLATLLEMFPGACNLEVQHCLASCGGDLEQATTLILQRQEQGISIKATPGSKLVPGAKGNKKKIDDKEVRISIINRYGFVDHDDDTREHRPVAPKWEGKKMVRYRDNKVVSLKGERYTEFKKDETAEMKKTYVHLKPGKQYRFH